MCNIQHICTSTVNQLDHLNHAGLSACYNYACMQYIVSMHVVSFFTFVFAFTIDY